MHIIFHQFHNFRIKLKFLRMAVKTFDYLVSASFSSFDICHSYYFIDVLQMCHAVTHLYLCICGSLSFKYLSHSLENSCSSRTGLRHACLWDTISGQTPLVRFHSFFLSPVQISTRWSITQYHCNIYFFVKTTSTHYDNLLIYLLFPSTPSSQFLTS